jgi:uncharacterized protein (DUF1778 family)
MKKKALMTETIQVRCHSSDLELLDRAAQSIGISRSALIRHSSEAHARRVLKLDDEYSSRVRS